MRGKKKVWSSLENYTSNNTRQHETIRHNTSTTWHNTSTNTAKHETTPDNRNTIWHNTSKTRLNISPKEGRTAKIGLYFALFVTKLYIFLISFGNSWCSHTCNIISTIWIPRALRPSKMREELPNPNPKGIVKSKFWKEYVLQKC